MKASLPLLPLFARPLLGHRDSSHAEICGLEQSPIPLVSPVCLVDPNYAGFQKNSSRLSRHSWTQSSPCSKGEWSEQHICVFTNASFAGGRGISLVTTSRRANYLATTPAFVEPGVVEGINRGLSSAKAEMREIPGKGMGLIATAHIQRGELLMAETPSLMVDYRAFDELSKEQYTSLQAHAVRNLPAPHSALVLSLSTHTTNTSHLTFEERIDLVASTNSFDIEPDDGDDADQHNSFYSLFPAIARFNHDCRPNADYRFSHRTLAQYIHAARDIAPGEELTLSYINPLMSRAERQARLRQWGFECACPLCAVDGDVRREESDRRIESIKKIREELADWDRGRESSRACPQMAELLVSLYRMERLDTIMYEAYMFAALEYNAAGDPWTAVKYARLAVEWGVPMVEEEDEELADVRQLAEDPWGHWSWLKRVK
ncbi:uncharacterized protein B0T15DRAFT_305542 [Chaetomium strumarium]|uniref:SET domain-containing protein n=1 Tax=Chaetomium strumarium TaxID=1170767 RepID=A0AAJ0GMH4_9PEZI|nr:hypothetical protein B0T15DRAFT_305542 [Chaetomium strumarium]